MRARASLVVALVALAGVLALAAFPAHAYRAQSRERTRVAAEIRTLAGENGRLEERARRLQTDAEIERLARQHYNLVRPGEEVYAIIPTPPPPAPPAPSPTPRPRAGWWHRATAVLIDVF